MPQHRDGDGLYCYSRDTGGGSLWYGFMVCDMEVFVMGLDSVGGWFG